MGDYHNLFGSVNEAYVYVEPDGKRYIRNILRGNAAGEVMKIFGHDPEQLTQSVASMLDAQVREGRMEEKEAARVSSRYRAELARYPYLTC